MRRALPLTTDPGRETPQVLRSYLDRPSGGYEVDRTTYVFAVGGRGTAPLVRTGTDSPAPVAADVKNLLADGQASAQEGAS